MTIQAQTIFSNGLKAHQEGNFAKAEIFYQESLSYDPNHPDAKHLLALLYHEQGKYPLALALINELVLLYPQNSDLLNSLGMILMDLCRFEEAASALEQAITYNADHDEAYLNLGLTYQYLGRPADAIPYFQKALMLRGDDSDVHNNLGNAYRDTAQPELAIRHYLKATEVNPHCHQAYYNLSGVYQQQGNLKAAIEYSKKALQQQPQFAEAYNALGSLYCQLSLKEESIQAYQEAVRINPNLFQSQYNLGVVLYSTHKYDEALSCYYKALALQPESIKVLESLVQVLLTINKTEEALTYLQKAYEIEPDDALLIKMALILPILYESEEEVTQWRDRMIHKIRELNNRDLDLKNPVVSVGMTSFYLTYQGQNDREIQHELASLYRNIPTYSRSPESLKRFNAKPKVGFISRFFRQNHTIGKLTVGLLEHISRDIFDIAIIHLSDENNRTNTMPAKDTDIVIEVPLDNIEEACRKIAELELDILHFTDIGMEPTAYFIAFSRLAPVQCVWWGHPMTTGIPTIDYFISSQHLEISNGQEHYTEELVLFENPLLYYYRPELPEFPKTRVDFGFREDVHLYVSPQSHYKFHPVFDQVIGGILREDPKGQFIMIHGNYRHYVDFLMRRWQRTIPDVVDRIRFINSLSHENYLSLCTLSDVLIDPFPYGGGNTHYEAFAFGTPVVTMPSDYLPGRITHAMYQQMGVLDCLVNNFDDYIQTAVKLGTDSIYRETIKQKILANNHKIYETIDAVKDGEAFFLRAINKAKEKAKTEAEGDNHGHC